MVIFFVFAYFYLLPAAVCFPIARFLRRRDRPWDDVIVLLMFVAPPTWALFYTFQAMYEFAPGTLSRATFWLTLLGPKAVAFFVAIWIPVGGMLYFWKRSENQLREQKTLPIWRAHKLLTRGALILFAISLPLTIYLMTYITLEEAVLRGHSRLAQQRLRFNLPGLTLDNGRVIPPREHYEGEGPHSPYEYATLGSLRDSARP